MIVVNFEELFISHLEKEDNKIHEFLEENKNSITTIEDNKELLNNFINKINNSIIHSVINFDFFKSVFKNYVLNELYD